MLHRQHVQCRTALRCQWMSCASVRRIGRTLLLGWFVQRRARVFGCAMHDVRWDGSSLLRGRHVFFGTQLRVGIVLDADDDLWPRRRSVLHGKCVLDGRSVHARSMRRGAALRCCESAVLQWKRMQRGARVHGRRVHGAVRRTRASLLRWNCMQHGAHVHERHLSHADLRGLRRDGRGVLCDARVQHGFVVLGRGAVRHRNKRLRGCGSVVLHGDYVRGAAVLCARYVHDADGNLRQPGTDLLQRDQLQRRRAVRVGHVLPLRAADADVLLGLHMRDRCVLHGGLLLAVRLGRPTVLSRRDLQHSRTVHQRDVCIDPALPRARARRPLTASTAPRPLR